jgi:succinylglutamic semialdehyde dehydrogenase
MAADTAPVKFLGDFINGQFVLSDRSDGSWVVKSPADLKDTVIEVSFDYVHIDRACEAAKKAFKSWSHLNLDERKRYLLRLKEVYTAQSENMAKVIARETGKPLWESKTEVAAMINKIDITLNDSLKLIEEHKVPNALPGVDGYIRYKPRGVMAVIGPFNFPGHLPNGHIVPALITGNTVIFKPSEKTPGIAQLMAQCFQEAGFPAGVFNVVHGLGETGKRVCSSEYVDGILFTGSYDVGLRIKQETLTHHNKILALEMGGKNATIVWEDAQIEKAIYENLVGSFLTAGQRCSGTSRIILHKKIAERFISNFYEAAKKIKIGHWNDNPFMGPLISADAVEKFVRFQEIAKREGADSLMRGKALDSDHQGYYVTPSINIVKAYDPKSVYQKTEIFGPNVAIYTVDDFEQALEINNSTGFGLVLSVFSENKSLYEKALMDAQVGIVNWNRSTNGASSKLPFGGMGKSGNDRASAHFAVYYCTVPVSSLEDTTAFDRSKLFPGIVYDFK